MSVSPEILERLPAPAWYRPYAKGVYAVTPGLNVLGHDFGNGPVDGQVFQVDREFGRYHANKLAARVNFDRHVGTEAFTPAIQAAVCAFVSERLCAEYPELFSIEAAAGGLRLTNRLTGETVRFSVDFSGVEGANYVSAWDALAMQVQADLCVMTLGEDENWTSAVHVTAPNYWRPAQIVGAGYNAVHGPVPGMDRLKAKAPKLLETIAGGARYVRFVWGLETDDQLNHHPDVVGNTGRGKAWADAAAGERRLYLRLERQTLVGLPEVSSLLFVIRTYIRDIATLPKAERWAIAEAVEGMNPDERAYKGLKDCAGAFVDHLRAQ